MQYLCAVVSDKQLKLPFIKNKAAHLLKQLSKRGQESKTAIKSKTKSPYSGE